MKTCFFTISILLSTLSYGQENLKLLQGKWVSAEDKKYKVVITDSFFIEYYGKKKTSIYTYIVENGKLIKMDSADKSVYSYDIMSLTNKYLSLMYLTRGNILVFKRSR